MENNRRLANPNTVDTLSRHGFSTEDLVQDPRSEPFGDRLARELEALRPVVRRRGIDDEDCIQDAAVSLWANRDKLVNLSTADFSKYVNKTVTNKGRDRARRHWRRQPTAGPGWYRDPAQGTIDRYWDGDRWTGTVRDGLGERRSETSVTSSTLRPRCPIASTEYLNQAAADAWQPRDEADVEDAVVGRAVTAELSGLIHLLPPRQAEAITLHLQGSHYREIADIQGITPCAANSLLVHGRANLRRLAEQQGILEDS